jgi:hypothetical protein
MRSVSAVQREERTGNADMSETKYVQSAAPIALTEVVMILYAFSFGGRTASCIFRRDIYTD